jgi:hypothetical protein
MYLRNAEIIFVIYLIVQMLSIFLFAPFQKSLYYRSQVNAIKRDWNITDFCTTKLEGISELGKIIEFYTTYETIKISNARQPIDLS